MIGARALLALGLLSCTLVMACGAQEVDLVTRFPHWNNGENNIFLQYRVGSEYHDLKPMGDAVFAHPDSPSTVPYAGPVISVGTRANLSPQSYGNADRVYIRPAMVQPPATAWAGVIRVIPPVNEGRVEITGEAGIRGDPCLHVHLPR